MSAGSFGPIAARTALLGAAMGILMASPVTAGAAPAALQPAIEGAPAAGAPAAAVPQATGLGAPVPSGIPASTGTPGAAGPSALPAAGSAVPTDDIRDIRGPKPLASPWLVWALIGAGILAVLLAFALWMWIKRRRRAPEMPDFAVALGRLEAARALMQPGRGREFSIEVSGIVREYIERRFNVMAAHRTTHEFLHDLVQSADPSLAAHRDLLGEFLQSCDLAKFGGWNLSTAQMDTMLEGARRFIQSASASAAGTEHAASAAQGAAPAAPDSHSPSGKSHVSLPTT
jgi:Domain of unknown function (DUF4381)